MKSKIVSLIVIIVIIFTFTTSCSTFGSYLTKEQIIEVVKNNQELFNKIPVEIKSFKTQLIFISTTEKSPIENEVFPDEPIPENIKGLYLIQYVGDDYTALISSLKNDLFTQLLNIKGIVSIVGNVSDSGRFSVFFECGGKGFGSAMTYYGFYYTEDNLPIGWLGYDDELVQNGASCWTYTEKDSDNTYYTERIIDNWFYFEMHW